MLIRNPKLQHQPKPDHRETIGSTRDGAMTISRLRSDIDKGRMGDKVAFFDPAAAPLGTDEEAAGTPVSTAAIEQAKEYELSEPRAERANMAVAIFAGAIFALVAVSSVGFLIR